MNDEMLGHCIKILEQSITNAENESNCILSTTEAYCIIGALEDNKAVPPNSIINHLDDEIEINLLYNIDNQSSAVIAGGR